MRSPFRERLVGMMSFFSGRRGGSSFFFFQARLFAFGVSGLSMVISPRNFFFFRLIEGTLFSLAIIPDASPSRPGGRPPPSSWITSLYCPLSSPGSFLSRGVKSISETAVLSRSGGRSPVFGPRSPPASSVPPLKNGGGARRPPVWHSFSRSFSCPPRVRFDGWFPFFFRLGAGLRE